MLIEIRIVLALLGFAARWVLIPRNRFVLAGSHGDTAYAFRKKTYKKDTEHWVGMPLQAPAPFRIHDEEPLDRLGGREVLADPCDESPRRDRWFLACHHPAIRELLDEDSVRTTVLAALEHARELLYDGKHVWLQTSAQAGPTHLDALVAVRRAFAPVAELPRRVRDSYQWKTLLVEAVVWACVGYTLGAILGYLATGRERVHVEVAAIVVLGIVLGAVIFGAMFAAAVFWLRGATRGYGAYLVHAFLLSVTPVVGVQLGSDLNRGLDDSASFTREGVAVRCEKLALKGGPAYEMTLQEHEAPIREQMDVVEEICDSIHGPTSVTFTLGKGFLGLAWFRKIETPTAIWSPP